MIAVAAVAAVVGVVVAIGGDESGSSGCLSELARHVPLDGGVIQGGDLERARAAGMDDSTGVEGAMDWLIETGVGLDPLTSRSHAVRPGEDPSSVTGYEPADVRCWAGDPTSFAARGIFDTERIASTDLGSSGEIEVDDDLLVQLGTATDQPAGGAGLARVAVSLLGALDDQGVVGFSGLSPDDGGEQWTAVGLARSDGWDLVIVWAFSDRAGADDAQGEVREALTGASAVAELVEGDPVERLERDGATLRLRAPLASEAPSAWYRLQNTFDPIFLIADR